MTRISDPEALEAVREQIEAIQLPAPARRRLIRHAIAYRRLLEAMESAAR